MYDYHIHSSFSGDSDMPMDNACEKAVSLGLQEISFTDHIDMQWPGDTYIFEEVNLDKYFSTIELMSQKYSGKITIRKGIELGMQPHVIDETLEKISDYQFDYILSSVHCVDCLSVENPEFYSGRTVKESVSRYFQEVLNIVTTFEHFSALGHIDFIRRYIPSNLPNTISYFNYCDILDSIFITLINKNKGIELNTSGFKYGLNSFLPTYEFVKRYKELGGEIITVGSDAHCVEYIGNKSSEALELLRKCGFKYITGFRELTPYFIKI